MVSLFHMRACQGWDMRRMLKPFYSNKPLINDHILNIVVKKHFIINEKVTDKKFVKAQIVRKLREKTVLMKGKERQLHKRKNV